MENVITLGKLIGLLFCSVPHSLFFSSLNSKNTRNDLARPVMGTIFWRASETLRSVQLRIAYILYIMVRANFVLITRKEGGA